MAVVYRSVLVSAGGITPNGKTVIPTDSVALWVACAGEISAGRTLAEILADTVLLTKLFSSNNANDYLVRSTSFASDVCADETAMQLIGANDYCVNLLLTNTDWFSAICNSTYFEYVLNVKVPIMTSNTTPSGVCSASSSASNYEPYRAFDGDAQTACSPSTAVGTGWLQYQFPQSVCVNKVGVLNGVNGGGVKDFDIMISTDGSTWETLLSDTNPYDRNWHYYSHANDKNYSYFKLNIKNIHNSQWWQVSGLQFYGRKRIFDVLDKVTMTNNQYRCDEAKFWIEGSTWYLRAKFTKLVTNGAVVMSADLSDWLENTATYTGFTAKTSGYNPKAFSSSFSNGILDCGIDTNSGVVAKPDNVDLEFYGTI